MKIKETFVTGGDHEIIYDEKGEVRYYRVLTKEGNYICLLKKIPEYLSKGHRVVIDEYGTPWVAK